MLRVGGAYTWRDLFSEFYGLTVHRFLLKSRFVKIKEKT